MSGSKQGWEEKFDQSPKLGKAFDELAIILQSRTTEDKARAATDEHKQNIKSFIASEITKAQKEEWRRIHNKPPFACDDCKIIYCGDHL